MVVSEKYARKVLFLNRYNKNTLKLAYQIIKH